MRRRSSTTTTTTTAPAPTTGWQSIPLTLDYWIPKWNARVADGLLYLEPPQNGTVSSALIVSKTEYTNARTRITYTPLFSQDWKGFWDVKMKILSEYPYPFSKYMNSLIPKSSGFMEMECAWDKDGENFAGPEPVCPPVLAGQSYVFESQINGQYVTAILNGKVICTNFKPTKWHDPLIHAQFFEGPMRLAPYSEVAPVVVSKYEVFV